MVDFSNLPAPTTPVEDDPFAVNSGNKGVGAANVDNYVMHLDGGATASVVVTPSEEGALFDFDLTGTPESNDFPVPPAGVYEAMVTDFETKNSSKGSPMVVFTFTLLKHSTNAAIPTHGAKVWDYIVISLSRVRDAFKALGLELKGQYRKADIIGRHVVLTVKHDSYEGRTTLKVSRYAPHPSGAGFKPALDDIPF